MEAGWHSLQGKDFIYRGKYYQHKKTAANNDDGGDNGTETNGNQVAQTLLGRESQLIVLTASGLVKTKKYPYAEPTLKRKSRTEVKNK